MNIELKDLPAKLAPIASFFKRYMKLLFILSILVAYALLVLQVNMLESATPSESAVADKLKAVQRPRIDQAALDKITRLQSQNVEVDSLFKQARENPFAD